MKSRRFLSFCLMISLLFLNAKSQSISKNAKRLYFGKYYSYKWIDEDVTAMDYKHANKLLKRSMIIDRNVFVFFNDTIVNPKYELMEVNKQDFFSDYKIDESNFKNLSETFLVLSISKEDEFGDTEVIISGKDRIINYKGYFYFFRKSKK
ncbi:MAG: hypothetical protein JST87_18640 [Bacteroidetes bacterium]|nr:hypothetical protein [Bacteroidota bacterium]